MNQVVQGYEKQIKVYSENVKSLNQNLKTLLHTDSIQRGLSSTTMESMDTALTDYQKKIYENMKTVSNLQKEMMQSIGILKNSHLIFTMKFFYSPELSATVNEAMNRIENIRTPDGELVSFRHYDPEKIIRTKPSLRTQLAKLCGYIYNLTKMEQGHHPTTRYLLEQVNNSISELCSTMNEKLQDYDDVLETGGYSAFSIGLTGDEFQFPFLETVQPATITSPGLGSFIIPEPILPEGLGIAQSSGRKRSTPSQSVMTARSRPSTMYHVPKRYQH